MRNILMGLLLALLAVPARGDAIDDWEAKNRGVPVGQVLAEKALAQEQRKTAELTKKVADLQKKVAEIQAQKNAASAAAAPEQKPVTPAAPQSPAAQGLPKPQDPSTGTGGMPEDGLPTATPEMLANFAAQQAQKAGNNADGRHAPSPLYDDFVKRYMAGDWENLAADMRDKQKDVDAMAPGNIADLGYIKQAMIECAPAWWSQAKAGKSLDFNVTAWKQTFPAHFRDGPDTRVEVVGPVGTQALHLYWPGSHMDNPALGRVANFTDGDCLSPAIWRMIENTRVCWEFDSLKLPARNPEAQKQYNRYIVFRGFLTAAYYGKPRARQCVLVDCLNAMMPQYDQDDGQICRRPLAHLLEIEFVTHSQQYPSFMLANGITDLPGAGEEGADLPWLQALLIMQMQNIHLTFAEDRALREAVRTLAEANADLKAALVSPIVKLPNQLESSLDQTREPACAAKRMAFLRAELSKPKP